MKALEITNKLIEINRTLREEFPGLESQIDRLIHLVTPPLVLPEIIEKPYIINLWGMTSTGKTSTVKRLIELLGENCIQIPVNTISKDKGFESESITNAILRQFGFSEYSHDGVSLVDIPKRHLIIIDEAQHLKSKNEKGESIEQPNRAEIWEILNTGKIDYRFPRYERELIAKFIQTLEISLEEFGDTAVENLRIVDSEYIYKFLSKFSFGRRNNVWADRGNPIIFGSVTERNNETGKWEPADVDVTTPLSIFGEMLDNITSQVYAVDRYKSEEIKKAIFSAKKLSEIVEPLLIVKKIVTSTTTIDISKSIIFIIGNDNNIFTKTDISDFDADRLHLLTSKVTESELINSLMCNYFTPEQVRRFGRNFIIYPSYSEKDFRRILKSELNKINKRILDNYCNKPITYTNDIVDLLYSEGVEPSQGTGSIFSIIESIYNSIIIDSLTYIERNEIEDFESIIISVYRPEEGYSLDKKNIIVTFKGAVIKNSIKNLSLTIEITLIKGSRKNPQNNMYRAGISVHEMGHAIMCLATTGLYPTKIQSCMSIPMKGQTILPDGVSLSTYRGLEDEYMIGVAGYIAERLIFSKEHVSFGSSNDIQESFAQLSHKFYKGGYLTPMPVDHEHNLNNNIPLGIDESDSTMKELTRLANKLMERTEKILKANLKLLVEGSIILSERGELSSKEFEEIVKLYSSDLPNMIQYIKDSRNYLANTTAELFTAEKKKEGWFKRLLTRLF